jgi:hypothetical protein
VLIPRPRSPTNCRKRFIISERSSELKQVTRPIHTFIASKCWYICVTTDCNSLVLLLLVFYLGEDIVL